MKNLAGLFFFVLTIGFLTSCSSAPEGEKVEAKEATETAEAPAEAATYVVDPAASVVRWTGTKPTGQHTGTMKLSGGKLAVEGDNITAGSFEMDMTSIECTDLKAGEGKEDLEGHLKTGDFFEVEKHPTGTFEVASVAAVTGGENTDVTHTITGNLTLKGITKSVTFPANVAMMGDKISAQTPSFTINRTEWGINFHSSTLADTAKDNIINDEIGLVITLVATKN